MFKKKRKNSKFIISSEMTIKNARKFLDEVESLRVGDILHLNFKDGVVDITITF